MESPYIILIGGGTGVGTSTVASELSKIYPVRGFQRTDTIRQVIRTIMGPLVIPEMFQSTYRAYENIDSAYEDPIVLHSPKVLYGHVKQSETVMLGVDGAIARDIEERINSIYEGVHVLPGKLNEDGWYNKMLRKKTAEALSQFGMRLLSHEDYANHIVEIFIDINDPNLHRQRLEQREAYAPDRPSSKYLENFDNIRQIRNFLVKEAESHGIIIVQNISLEEAVEQCIKHISARTDGKFMPATA